jgi:carboxyl-terminal processing protease
MKIAPLLKPLVALFAVSFAFGLTFLWPMRNGLDLDFGGSERAQAARNLGPYDLTKLQVLTRAILEVKDHYVEPERVNPQRMLISGLNAIQRSVAPVLVHYEEGAPDVEVQVNDQTRRFRVDDVNAPWTLAHRFREVFGFLQENLEEEDGIELRDIEYAAVNGMLRTLDPHTVLLTPDVYEEMRMSTRGEFGGLGIVISIPDGHLTIMEPMPNTPASRAGLLAGDRIVKINDESTLNMPLSEAVDRLRGAPGSQVAVWIVRPGSWTQQRRFELTRDVIQIESIESRKLEGGVGATRTTTCAASSRSSTGRASAASCSTSATTPAVSSIRPCTSATRSCGAAPSSRRRRTIPRSATRRRRTRRAPSPTIRSSCSSTAAAPRPPRSSPARSRRTTAR